VEDSPAGRISDGVQEATQVCIGLSHDFLKQSSVYFFTMGL
jgi:hypothetical protein